MPHKLLDSLLAITGFRFWPTIKEETYYTTSIYV